MASSAPGGGGGAPTPDVVATWEEVADDLRRSEKVPKEKALEAVENAQRYFQNSLEARSFASNHLADIVDAVLELRHNVVEKLPRCKVERMLRAALEIVNRGINLYAYSSWLRVMAVIFDKRKPYYDGSSGRPETRIVQIKHFHRNGDFARLLCYISSWPNLAEYFAYLRPLLAAVFEAVYVTKGKEIKSADRLSKLVMGHLDKINGEGLARILVRQIREVCAELHRINRRLAFSGVQKLSDHHEFWMKLTLKLMRSGSAEHKSLGMDQITSMIESVHVPKAYTVSGAGSSFVNGRYELATSAMLGNGRTSANLAVSYERAVPEDHPNAGARGKKMKLHPCVMTEAGVSFLNVWWFVSEDDGEDYYYNKSTGQDGKPPVTGWDLCANGEGAAPSPTLECHSEMVEVQDGRSILSEQLSKWMVREKVFDDVIGEHDRFMSIPTAMTRFLSEVGRGDGNGSSRDAMDAALGQKTRMLESILPLLLEDTKSPPAQQPSVAAASPQSVTASLSSSPYSSSEFFTAMGAARQRLASAERWRRSAQNALREYLLAAGEERDARSYLAGLERSREVIDVDEEADSESGDERGDSSDYKKQSKRRRKR